MRLSACIVDVASVLVARWVGCEMVICRCGSMYRTCITTRDGRAYLVNVDVDVGAAAEGMFS